MNKTVAGHKRCYRSGHVTPPAAVNMLTAAGKGARRGKATIYRDLLAAADAFARRGKAKTTAEIGRAHV